MPHRRHPARSLPAQRSPVAAGAAALATVAAVLALLPAARAAPADDLAALLNEARRQPQRCGDRTLPPAPALVPHDALARAEGDTAAALRRALGAAGFPAARVQLLTALGPRDAARVLALLRGNPGTCAALADPGLAAVGVRQQGTRWRIVLAQPLLAADLGDWRQAGRQVLALVNAARATPRRCGSEPVAAAPPLRWNEALGAAALAHSTDMARRRYFEHHSPEGTAVDQRARRAGYDWRSVGENIAYGTGSAQRTVQGWIDSPGHCRNLMDPAFAEMGAAYALSPGGDAAIYWTQVFGTAR